VEVDEGVRDYIDGIDEARRPLFDRVDRLIRADHPAVATRIAYKMPTYDVGDRGLHVAVWKHGVSFYGWRADADDGFAARHPGMSSGKGTLRISTADAEAIDDDELRGFFRAVFAP
jgi:uncharacterized protein YdhG (YjbR/CyaY superfamily)